MSCDGCKLDLNNVGLMIDGGGNLLSMPWAPGTGQTLRFPTPIIFKEGTKHYLLKQVTLAPKDGKCVDVDGECMQQQGCSMSVTMEGDQPDGTISGLHLSEGAGGSQLLTPDEGGTIKFDIVQSCNDVYGQSEVTGNNSPTTLDISFRCHLCVESVDPVDPA